MKECFTAEQMHSMVATALHLAGVADKSTVRPLPAKVRNFTRGNGGPSEKHGLSLKRYFALKDGTLDRRIYA